MYSPVKEINSSITQDIPSNTNEAAATIKKATAYQWYVTAAAEEAEADVRSEIWEFYNAGDGVINHVPFHCE